MKGYALDEWKHLLGLNVNESWLFFWRWLLLRGLILSICINDGLFCTSPGSIPIHQKRQQNLWNAYYYVVSLKQRMYLVGSKNNTTINSFRASDLIANLLSVIVDISMFLSISIKKLVLWRTYSSWPIWVTRLVNTLT